MHMRNNELSHIPEHDAHIFRCGKRTAYIESHMRTQNDVWD